MKFQVNVFRYHPTFEDTLAIRDYLVIQKAIGG
jgi:hypothetical protein